MPETDFSNQRKWHVDKTLNVSHIVATLMIAGTLFGFVSRMDQRVTILEERLAAQTNRQDQAINDLKEITRDLRDEFRGLRIEIMRAVQPSNDRKQRE